MELKKKIGITLYQLRIQDANERLSQEDVANDAGISLRYYSGLEKGERMPSLETIEKIAGVYGKTISELCKLIESQS